MKRFMYASVGVVALALAPYTWVFADVLWFEDDFDGAVPDTSVWVIDEGDGSVYVQDGWLHLETQGEQVYFPFVYAREDPFPAGDLSCEIRIQYLTVFNFGNGHGCSNPDSLIVWGIWQGLSTSLLVNVFGHEVYQGSGADSEPHDFTFELVGTTCTAFMDGGPLGSRTSSRRPSSLLFGHNPDTVPGWAAAWTTFRVDYVRIWQLGPTAAEPTTWSAIKSLYR